jgi:hypothetical protein
VKNFMKRFSSCQIINSLECEALMFRRQKGALVAHASIIPRKNPSKKKDEKSAKT